MRIEIRGLSGAVASVLAGLALVGAVAAAQASPIDVSYTVSGSAGNWTYDFSVTNNLGGTNDIYYFGVEMIPGGGGRNIAGSPPNWDPDAINSVNWSTSSYGGLNITYDNIWINVNYPTSILPGQTLSGFQVGSSAATPLSSVPWFAWSAVGTYPGSFCNINCGAPFGNPGFQYDAFPAVPEPSAMWLLGSGVVGLGGRRWLRRQSTI